MLAAKFKDKSLEEFKVGVVGAGYVGLVTGACLAHVGHQVVCADRDAQRVAQLSEGQMPIYEPRLEELVADDVRKGRLRFSTELAEAVRGADVVFIAVDTPQGDDGAADLSRVATVAQGVGQALAEQEEKRTRPLVVVNKSTVPVGSGDYVSMLVREVAAEGGNPAVDYRVVSNPEFLREGSAVYDSLFPDRIVLGADERDALDVMRALYEPVIEQSFPTDVDPRPKAAVPFVTTDLVSAEMIKYAANAFLATKISFVNEIASVCELVGADVGSVAHGIGLDGRIGSRFLNAGIGWGGSCFPKDVAALRAVAREYDHETTLLDATVAVNDRQLKKVISKLQRDLFTLKGKRVALLGLSFKPNTDDVREAPSLKIAEELHARGTRVIGYDPVAGKKLIASTSSPNLQVVFDPYEALSGAHAAVVVTEWMEVRSLDLERAASLMNTPKLLVDGRNVFEPGAASAAGLLYRGFGRG
ncbi:MAG: UDP-glucose 6-dehydrogenase [uncultured Chloroflexia bacterium]|uniref:UDP-glucose 6-dehydrogenase n=1 Tax=uncultured Chloroflexia bacterium TaxID=1672391 RepID=A0A6J4NK47_9CHLR|nr:MAG: UDP-glucose 6-dehydrogenase [uncultured Chloroflexia bacterium]